MSFYRIIIAIYRNNYSDISTYYCVLSNYYCDISTYYSDISNYYCDISKYYSDISNYCSDISTYYCVLSNYYFDISNKYCFITKFINTWKGSHFDTSFVSMIWKIKMDAFSVKSNINSIYRNNN